MRFSQFRDLIRAILINTPYEKADIVPGTEQSGSSWVYLVLTPVQTPGLQVEGLIDTHGWQVEAVGDQNDYESAEALAFAVDTALLKVMSGTHGSTWVVGIDRIGSPPVPLTQDDADRTHFVCSYIATVKSALA